MKLATIALASFLAVSSTAAFAQTNGGGSGAQVHRKHHAAKSSRAKHHAGLGSSMGSGRNSGDAITTGSGAPQNNPNVSRSSETSDTGRKVP
jgi:hypothetical protein